MPHQVASNGRRKLVGWESNASVRNITGNGNGPVVLPPPAKEWKKVSFWSKGEEEYRLTKQALFENQPPWHVVFVFVDPQTNHSILSAADIRNLVVVLLLSSLSSLWVSLLLLLLMLLLWMSLSLSRLSCESLSLLI
jgi:hypothetical protein